MRAILAILLVLGLITPSSDLASSGFDSNKKESNLSPYSYSTICNHDGGRIISAFLPYSKEKNYFWWDTGVLLGGSGIVPPYIGSALV
jgi:hypothetical protein